MTSHRKPGFVLPVAVTLTVLLGLYVGAYYAMVNPVPLPEPTPIYRFRGLLAGPEQTWGRFFATIHWLDRRIRPHVWEPE